MTSLDTHPKHSSQYEVVQKECSSNTSGVSRRINTKQEGQVQTQHRDTELDEYLSLQTDT